MNHTGAPAATMGEPASRREILSVYAAAVIQGVALVSFPAVSVVFTNAADYGLTNQAYGGIFVPQAIMAIVSSLVGSGLSRRIGAKRVYLIGLNANLLAMALLVCSRFVMHEEALAYLVLLAATASLGAGFGFTVPALNTFAAAFFPRKAGMAVLGLNALLGLGTMLAPLFVLLFVGMGMWWGMPVFVGAACLLLVIFSTDLPLRSTSLPDETPGRQSNPKLPPRFWLFAAFALLYGICETMNGNWASVYMTKLGAGTAFASLALTVFWAAVTAGRVLFAVLDKWLPGSATFRILPLVVTCAFVVTAGLQSDHPQLGIAAFAAAGLGCSGLLPLLISLGQQELTGIAASVAGGLICAYQVGYGIAAFGAGPLQVHAGLRLQAIYGATAVVALLMSALSFALVGPPVKQV
jgi:MFS family permease